MAEVKARLAAGVALQKDIWKGALAACRLPGAAPQATQLLLPALNEMIDITETRQMQTANHPPVVIFWLLGALLVGYAASSNKRRTWIHQATFALVMSLAIYVIIDIEYPRLGMIRVSGADQVLPDLAESLR